MGTRLNRRRLVAALVAVLAAGAVVWGTTPGTMAETPDMTVEKVLVNKLGGVSVVGTIDCSDFAAQVRTEGLAYVGEDEAWQVIGPIGTDAELNISSNSDNYTVSQPAGRRGMITATHQSSRMSPCYVEKPEALVVDEFECEPAGAPCTWVTDHDKYESTQPLFDYSTDGKFKAGLLAVEAESVGVLVEVFAADENGVPTYEAYYAPNGWGAYTSTTLKAVSYR